MASGRGPEQYATAVAGVLLRAKVCVIGTDRVSFQAMKALLQVTAALFALVLVACEEMITDDRIERPPSFGGQTVADQTYTEGTAIVPLVLPAATGGDSPLTYSLTPNVPGLVFTSPTRTLQGAPTAAGTHSMTYRVVDRGGDARTLTFVLRINGPEDPYPELDGLPPLCRCTSVTWSETLSRFVAVGKPHSVNGTAIIYSDDGETWYSAAEIPSVDGGTLTGVTWGETLLRFVAVGSTKSGRSIIFYSSDGDIWHIAVSSGKNLTEVPRNEGWALYDVTWSESLSLFVAVGGTGIIYSTDGSSWISSLADLYPGDAGIQRRHKFHNIVSVIWIDSQSKFVAVGRTSYEFGEEGVNVFHSSDGVNWKTYQASIPRAHPYAGPSLNLERIVWSESLSRFVAIAGLNELHYSSDSITWSKASDPPSVQVEVGGGRIETVTLSPHSADLAWSQSLSLFVVAFQNYSSSEPGVTQRGHIAYSANGDTWKTAQLPPSPIREHAHSYNGITWSESLSRFVSVGYGYLDNTNCHMDRELPCGYVYYGAYDWVLYSEDGREWDSSVSYECRLKTTAAGTTFCAPQEREKP